MFQDEILKLKLLLATDKNNNKVKTIACIVGMMIIIQTSRICIKQVIFTFIERTDYSDSIASMLAVIVLSILFIIFARNQKVSLSIFPKHFGKFHIISTCVAIILLVATPSNYSGGFQAIILLFYTSMVIPIFEEMIFRGYIWNKLNVLFEKEWVTYIISTVLFALWHMGYIDALAFRVGTGLAIAVFWELCVIKPKIVIQRYSCMGS